MIEPMQSAEPVPADAFNRRCLVQLYDHDAVADSERLGLVAEHVARSSAVSSSVIVVVSAMGDTHRRLLQLAKETSDSPTPRQLDVLLSSAERITAALLSMALQSRGLNSAAVTGSQAGIITTSAHGHAVVESIRPRRLEELLRDHVVPVVAGNQGMSFDSGLTTLGPGGDVLSAVHLACALGCGVCELYSARPALFTGDPEFIQEPRRIDEISLHEFRELTEAGGVSGFPVSAIAIAIEHRLPLRIRSAFTWEAGTEVVPEPSDRLPQVRAIAVRAVSPVRSDVSVIGSELPPDFDIGADVRAGDEPGRTLATGHRVSVEVASHAAEGLANRLHRRHIAGLSAERR